MIASPVFATDRWGIYAGAAVGSAKYDYDTNRFAWSFIEIEDDDEAYGVLFGVQPNPHLAIEASYADLGYHKAPLDSTVTMSAGFERVSVSALVSDRVGRLEIYAKAGMARWNAELSFRQGVGCIVEDPCPDAFQVDRVGEHGIDPLYGFGMQFRHERLGLRVEFESLRAEDRATLLSVGAIWFLR